MSSAPYDALIIGGGPGGSTVATYLARAGKRVLVLEKEKFPRFHIGESLLPYNRRIFQEMGILPELEAFGFPRKFGAQFHNGNAANSTMFVFRNGKFTEETEAFQVERATFDHMLLKHAATSGAEVREGWTAVRFVSDADGVTLEARNADKCETFHGKFLIDASGRGNITGNQENLREVHPKLKKLAIFGHFLDVKLDEGEKRGDTVIVRLENKWFWIIPISKEKTSVGLVMDADEFANAKLPANEIFQRVVAGSQAIRARMQMAKLVGSIHTTSDFSYKNRRFTGQRLLRVGDAAAFMDPIFSAGVYMAMYSGKLAANIVLESLNANDDGSRRFGAYEKKVHDAMAFYWEMVEKFYTTPFMELFFAPREKYELVSAVNAALAGDVDGGWKIRWRLKLFFLLVKLQSRWPLVPRISFDEGKTN